MRGEGWAEMQGNVLFLPATDHALNVGRPPLQESVNCSTRGNSAVGLFQSLLLAVWMNQ